MDKMILLLKGICFTSVFFAVLKSSKAFTKCHPSEVSRPFRAQAWPESPSLHACDVCFHQACDGDECATEAHALALQNTTGGQVQVDIDILNNATQLPNVVLFLFTQNPATWTIHFRTEDVTVNLIYATYGATVEFRNKYGQPLPYDLEPIVAIMNIWVGFDGENITTLYNSDYMSEKCLVSFTGVEWAEKITLYVGIIDMLSDGLEKVTDLILLVGAVVGGSLAFICLVGFTFVALRNKEKKKENARKGDANESGVPTQDSPPPRYSQAIMELPSIPPAPTTPLPPAPGENIYAELGEKPTATDSGYLEPATLQAPEQIYEHLVETEDGESYEELREENKTGNSEKEYEPTRDFPKISKDQGLEGGEKYKNKDEEKSNGRRKNRSDEDEDGYLKMSSS